MIQDDKQLQITQNRLERLRTARADINIHGDNSIVYTSAIKGIESLINNLETEIEEYNDKN